MFRFELEPVLDLKRQEEDVAKRRLAEAREKLRMVTEALHGIEISREEMMEQWRQTAGKMDTFLHQPLYDAWLEELRRRQMILESERTRRLEAVAKAHEALVEAHREVQKFEILRSQALREYNARLARLERNFLDELAVMRHRHRPETLASEEMEP